MLNPLPREARSKGARTIQTIATAIALLASFAATAAPERSATPGNAGLSRAEVTADLALWRRAGVDRYEVMSLSYGMETQEYRAAYQEYLRLRNSEEFQIEVLKALKD